MRYISQKERKKNPTCQTKVAESLFEFSESQKFVFEKEVSLFGGILVKIFSCKMMTKKF